MTPPRAINLRQNEARTLAEHGVVTVARRMDPQPHPSCSPDGCGWHWHPRDDESHYVFGTDKAHLIETLVLEHCPFGRVGDLLACVTGQICRDAVVGSVGCRPSESDGGRWTWFATLRRN